jgi:hypothetical protein
VILPVKSARTWPIPKGMNSPRPLTFLHGCSLPGPRRARDLTWGRVLFLPPGLLNPRTIFDPLPMRTQFPGPNPAGRPRPAR